MLGRRRRSQGPLDELSRASARCSRRWRRGNPTRASPTALVVTEAAVEKHVTRIFNKLQLGHNNLEHRRVHAVLTYLSNAPR